MALEWTSVSLPALLTEERIMNHPLRPLPLVLIAAAVMHSLAADPPPETVTSVSNLGNAVAGFLDVDDKYYIPPDDARFGVDLAQSFTTGAGTTLYSVTLDMAAGATMIDGGGFTVSLYSDSGDLPGALLAALLGDSTPNLAGLYLYTDPVATPLSAFTKYWIVASVPHTAPDKAYNWNFTTDTTQSGLAGWSLDGAALQGYMDGVVAVTWEALDAGASMKMSVEQPIPEASTWAAAGALALMAGAAWVRRKRS